MKKHGFLFKKRRKINELSFTARILIFALLLMPALAPPLYAQQRISIDASNASLDEVLQQVRIKSGYYILYNIEDVKDIDGLNINVSGTVNEVMNRCLENTGLTYVIENNTIIVSRRGPAGARITVRGFVTDENGQPLPGVSVQLKGTNIGTVTFARGDYSITLGDAQSMTLVFSYVGKKTQEVAIGTRREISVVMQEEEFQVGEVIITGYQEISRDRMVGSVSRLKADSLFTDGTRTLEQMLQGQLPGVTVINQSGLTGTRQTVRVRGTSTLWGNPEPVWVVDGIIQEDPLPFDATMVTDLAGSSPDMIKEFIGGAVSWLNPNDIDDVTVLKDASATAIYGVKAANGVIVITTKKGQQGRTSVSYSGNFSLTPRLTYNKMERMNSQQRVDASREAYEKGYILEREDTFGYMAAALAYRRNQITLEEFSALARQYEMQNTDWFGRLFRNAFSQNHSIGVSGGVDRVTYRASVGYSNTNNTARGNSQDQFTGSINISAGLWNSVIVSARISGSHSQTNSFAGEDPYTYAFNTSRALPDYDENGQYMFYNRNGYNYNILNELSGSGNHNTVSTLNSSLNVRWNILPYLTFVGTYGYNMSSSYGELWYSEATNNITMIRGYEYNAYLPGDNEYRASPLPAGGSLSVNESRNVNYTLRNQLDFNYSLPGGHIIAASFGQEVRSNKYDGYASTAYGYMRDRGRIFATVPLFTTQVGVDQTTTRENSYARSSHTITDQLANYLSWYGTANYMYDNRFAVDGSIRVDASNRFGQDRSARFQPVWSLGARWNISRESWMEDQNIFNDVALRVSYGFQGNVAENVSPDLIAQIVPVTDGSGDYNLVITNLPAPQLKWEKTQSLGFGVDFSLLQNRLNGSFDYYTKKTTDMIIEREVALENGVRNRLFNGGDMSNKGWDLGFNVIPIRNRDFMLAIGMNVSRVKNTLETNLEPLGTWEEAVSGGLYKVGYPVSSFWAWEFTGLNPQTGAPQFNFDGITSEGADIDATQYLKYAGKLEPDFTAGFNLSFRYKTLTLSSSFYLSTGNQQFLANPYETSSGGIPGEFTNMSTEWLDRWRQPGDQTDIPALPDPIANNPTLTVMYGNVREGTFRPYDLYPYSTVRVVDAWYLRCNNISLSYSLPERFISGFAQYMSVNFAVSNPFQLVSRDFQGRDPEVARGGQPLSRIYSFSMNINF